MINLKYMQTEHRRALYTMKKPNPWIMGIEEYQTKSIGNTFDITIKGNFPNLEKEMVGHM